MSYLWNVLSMKCLIYEMSFLWNVLSMKCPIYDMDNLWNVLSMILLSMKCLSMKCTNAFKREGGGGMNDFGKWKASDIVGLILAIKNKKKSLALKFFKEFCLAWFKELWDNVLKCWGYSSFMATKMPFSNSMRAVPQGI